MKKWLWVFLLPGWLFATSITFYVNNTESNTMVQGDQVRWFMTTNQPGGTLTIYIFRDVNMNQTLDSIDQLLDSFSMTDNDPNPDGPGDSDGLTNGELDVQLGLLGFATGDYIFQVVDEDGTDAMAPLHVDPMNEADVQVVLIGQIALNDVSSPNSLYAGFIFGLFTDAGIFMGQTDSTGHFTIPINVAVTGGEFDQMFDFSKPAKYHTTFEGFQLTISGDTTDVGTISYTAGNLRIHGSVLNQMEASLGRYLHIETRNEDGSLQNSWYVAPDGSYELYLPISQPETLHVTMDEDELYAMNYMSPDSWIENSPYKLYVDGTTQEQLVNIILYQFNDSIYVHLSGGEQDSTYRFSASNSSIAAYSSGYTDPATGFGIIPVSTYAKDYWVYLNEWETPPPTGFIIEPQGSQLAAPGDTVYFSFVNPTGLEENGTQLNTFKLIQNFPNPFNPSTTIQFYLFYSARVSLTIFNNLGEKIATLIDHEYYRPGIYDKTFSAGNLPSGIYFYKLEVGNRSQILKMVLMK